MDDHLEKARGDVAIAYQDQTRHAIAHALIALVERLDEMIGHSVELAALRVEIVANSGKQLE